MIAGLGNSDHEEIGIPEHGVGRSVSTSGVSPDSDAIDIDPWIARSEFSYTCNLIGKCVIPHIAVIRVLEFFRTQRRPHPVELDHDEPEFGEGLRVPACRGKSPRADAAGGRARIDV